jgi:hypothetical protein
MHLQNLIHNSYRLEVVTVDLRNILMNYKQKRNATLDFIKTIINTGTNKEFSAVG